MPNSIRGSHLPAGLSNAVSQKFENVGPHLEPLVFQTSLLQHLLQGIPTDVLPATVALKLGNTPEVCRKCYVHPAVLECYVAGSLCGSGSKRRGGEQALSAEEEEEALRREEKALMRLPRERLEAGERKAA
jgi:hypothetical protein